MAMELFHTPEGVRDIYDKECARKLTVQREIGRVFHQYGYEDIRRLPLNFLIFLQRSGAALLPGRCLSFLTGTTKRWC